MDPRVVEDRLNLLGLADVTGDGDLNHPAHGAVILLRTLRNELARYRRRVRRLVPRPNRAALDEYRPFAVGVRVRDLDHVEVARNHRVGEGRTRLTRELGTEIPARRMR